MNKELIVGIGIFILMMAVYTILEPLFGNPLIYCATSYFFAMVMIFSIFYLGACPRIQFFQNVLF